MNRLFYIAALLIAGLACLPFLACDPVEEQDGDLDLDGGGNGWEYPYYLVVGGGLSEALDLVTIDGPGDTAIRNDVRPTSAAISQTLVRGDELYAVCSLSHSVVVYETATLDIDREISLGVGTNPVTMAFDAHGAAYVTHFVTDEVTVFDLAEGVADGERLLATIAMPTGDELPVDEPGTETWARPGGIAAAGDRVYVALSNLQGEYTAAGPGVLAIIDANERALESTVELAGRDPISILHDEADGELYIASAGGYETGTGFTGDGGVDVFDLDSGEVTGWIALDGAPFDLTLCPNRRVFAGNGKDAFVLSFDADTHEPGDSVDIRGDDPLGLSFASALVCDGNNILYAVDFNHDRLFVIDTEDGDRVLTTAATTDGPDTLSLIR